jgi:benzoyl-CoA reductase subunit C
MRRLKGSENKKAIGCLCSYVPEEPIYAAGMFPVRVLSSEKSFTRADSIMQSRYCTFSRKTLRQGLSGNYGYLDGLVWGYTRNSMRFAFEAWQMHDTLPFSQFLYVPALIDLRRQYTTTSVSYEDSGGT